MCDIQILATFKEVANGRSRYDTRRLFEQMNALIVFFTEKQPPFQKYLEDECISWLGKLSDIWGLSNK